MIRFYHQPLHLLLTLTLAAVIAASGARAERIFKDGFERSPLATRQLKVDPGTLLFTTPGESASLAVSVFDSDGNPVEAPVRFRSTSPEVVSISTTGEITAQAPVGSAQVIVATDDALEVAILVLVADPVDDAIIIRDDQVLIGPELVDPDAKPGPGLQLRFVFTGIDLPAPATPVIGTGARAVGGRVRSAEAVEGGVEVVLEVVDAGELFDAYTLNETLSAARASVELNPEVAALYTLVRRLDGSVLLRQRPEAKGASRMLSLGENCEASPTDLTAAVQATLGSSVDFIPEFNVEVDDSDAGFERLVLEGSARTVAELSARTTTALTGKVTCKYALGSIIFPPPPGPLALLLQFATDFGIGFEVAGLVGFTQAIGYDITVSAQAGFSAGIECPAGVCEPVGSSTAEADGTFNPVYPQSLDTLLGSGKLQLDGSGFFFIDLAARNPFLQSIGISPLGIKAGLRQRLDLEAPLAQATNSTYGSDFRLELFASAGATTQFESLLNTLGIVVPPLTIEVFELLAQSPQGTLIITDPSGGSSATAETPATVQAGTADEPGELATFEVTLDPTTYLELYSVEEVQILELTDDGSGGQTLEFARPLCSLFVPDPGQTTFTCQTDFLDPGTRTFHLFVQASLFGIPLPFLLEAGKDTRATLDVIGTTRGLIEVARAEEIGGIDMSADGEIVLGGIGKPFPAGFSCGGADGCSFRWTPETGLQALDLRPAAKVNDFVSIERLSGDGTTIVGKYIDPNGDQFALRFTDDDGSRLLPSGGLDGSGAREVSADGRVIVGSIRVDAGQPFRAARWIDGQLHEIGAIRDATPTEARDVADAGAPVVGASSVGGFIWTPENGFTQPAIAGFFDLNAISADGSAIIGGGASESFILTDGVLEVINFPDATTIRLTDVSADGSVVVGHAQVPDARSGERAKGGLIPSRAVALRWTRETGTQTLAEWFADEGLTLPDLVESEAIAVSADGGTVLVRLQVGVGEELEGTGLYLARP